MTRSTTRAYLGRPSWSTANDYTLGVYNGDTGVVVDTPAGRRVVLAPAPVRRRCSHLAPSRLGEVETLHAMTIHKSQGSQADVVTVLLPDEESRLLTRELLLHRGDPRPRPGPRHRAGGRRPGRDRRRRASGSGGLRAAPSADGNTGATPRG